MSWLPSCESGPLFYHRARPGRLVRERAYRVVSERRKVYTPAMLVRRLRSEGDLAQSVDESRERPVFVLKHSTA